MSGTLLLDQIVEVGALRVLFQPIVELNGKTPRVHAVECLLRGPAGTNMESADVLFEYVRRKRVESLVDRVCVAAALRAARELPPTIELSVNMHASTLGLDPGMADFLRNAACENGVALARLTVELVEHTCSRDTTAFRGSIESLRALGVRIALDDVGLGYSNFKMMLESRPDYLKADRYLVSECDRDPARRAVLASLTTLARDLAARVVAEGVERSEELATIRSLGIDLVQGFLFLPAAPLAALLAWPLLRDAAPAPTPRIASPAPPPPPP